jgi:hypothetical protein
MVFPNPSSANQVSLGSLVFIFIDSEEYKKYNKEGKVPLGIIVFVKESFEWDKSNKPLDERRNWTNEDADKYGNLTIVDIRISEKNKYVKLLCKLA